MHFPLFQISPLFSKNLHTLWKLFKILPFHKKIIDFNPSKFLMIFFRSSTTNFEFPPIFPVAVHFPLFRENYYFPHLLCKIALCFRKIHLLFTYFMCISFPSDFDHDAFLHRPIHALDAPACGRNMFRKSH